jgi:NAD(P)H-dependent FMN reductase
MLEFPQSLKGVPTTFVGVAAGQFGAMRSIEQLSQIFSYRGAHIYGDRLFLPQIHSVLQQEKGDAGWSVGQHEERLQKLVDGFVTFVLANKT